MERKHPRVIISPTFSTLATVAGLDTTIVRLSPYPKTMCCTQNPQGYLICCTIDDLIRITMVRPEAPELQRVAVLELEDPVMVAEAVAATQPVVVTIAAPVAIAIIVLV